MDKVTGSDPVDGSSILPKRAIIKNKIFFTVDTFIFELYIILLIKFYIGYTKQAMSTKNVDIFLSTFI